jgi:alkanesulfonate monooxygenase SsuD/methylene tetrahydromethanopterin reductase-like flavin-dependent oxidoreductase (luciferase family)
MDYALFANVENPFNDPTRAMAELVATVRHAETLGFSAVWLTEHHFNRFSLSSSPLLLLAHLAAVTERIRLGVGALLLPLHDPIQVAEDLATLDLLSGQRLLLGVARGGPFPNQFKHFSIDPDEARLRMLTALGQVERLLAETDVHQVDRWHLCEGVTTEPRPPRPRLPTWIASVSPESIAHAAAHGHGLMAPSPMPAGRVADIFGAYRQAVATVSGRPWLSKAGEPLALARFFLCAPTLAQARAQAAPFIRDFAARMGAVIARGGPQPFGVATPALSEDQLLANAIVGDASACADQIVRLVETVGPHTLLLKPATDHPEHARHALSLFADAVRPRLDTVFPPIPGGHAAQGERHVPAAS